MSVSCSTGKNSLQTVHQRKSQELSRQAKAIKKVPKSAPPTAPAFPLGELGGHSLLATRLVARISHGLGARLIVKDVFDYAVFSELAGIIRQRLASMNTLPTASAGGQDIFSHPVVFKLSAKLQVSQLKGSSACADVEMPDYTAFQLIPADDVEKFTQDQINPQINFPKYMIQDVYLATHLQQCFLRDVYGRPKPLVPFYVEFPPDSRSFRVQAVLQRKEEERNVIQHPAG
ncbi:hypothetical protein G3M48_009157 [Beauveria asiatica]|uniref:Carrier domain-containing protein n=1 Tax=Beauveria asiatica TaxID=1069075 RepID=A0AAW0RJ54_9HYPO